MNHRNAFGQSSFEFIIIIAALLMMVLVSFSVINGRISSINMDHQSDLLSELGNILRSEIGIAKAVHGDYYREFVLPTAVEGINYSASLRNESDIELKTDSAKYIIFLEGNVTGSLSGGKNVIRKVGDTIYLNTEPVLPFDFIISTALSSSMSVNSIISQTIDASLYSGATEPVSFSVTSNQSGLVLSFSQAVCSLSCQTLLIIQATNSTPLGSYAIQVNASAANISKLVNITMQVNGICSIRYYYDSDNDSYGTSSYQCSNTSYYHALVPGDCDDSMATRYPGAPENTPSLCADGFRNDCSSLTEYDYDNQSRSGRPPSSHGSITCPVSVTNISVGNLTPESNTQINITCTANAPGANSIFAYIDENNNSIYDTGDRDCGWNPGSNWTGNQATFTQCNVGASGMKNVACGVYSSTSEPYNRSYQAGPDQVRQINVVIPSSMCSGLPQAFCLGPNCQWIPQCRASSPKFSTFMAGACIPLNQTISYVCSSATCNDTCDGSTGCPASACDNYCVNAFTMGNRSNIINLCNGSCSCNSSVCAAPVNSPCGSRTCSAPLHLVGSCSNTCSDPTGNITDGISALCSSCNLSCTCSLPWIDCNGNMTDGCESTGIVYYRDDDDDTWGLTGDNITACGPAGNYTAVRGGDCNDRYSTIYPSAPENTPILCSDGLNNNCAATPTEFDFDTLDRGAPGNVPSHGGISCAVGVSGAAINESLYCPGSTVNVQCDYTVSGTNSIVASMTNASCSPNGWIASSAFFRCRVSNSTTGSPLTATCDVNSSVSYASTLPRQATISGVSTCCSLFSTQPTCTSGGCSWASSSCNGSRYTNISIPGCYASLTYACRAGMCGASCDSNPQCTPYLTAQTCNYAGSCNIGNCSCNYSRAVCNSPGNVTGNTCYYGVLSCLSSGCSINSCTLSGSQICNASIGCVSIIPDIKPIITVGSVSGPVGTFVDLPISFTPGTNASSTLQYDIVFPTNLDVISISDGPAAIAAGKSCSGNIIGTSLRTTVLGLNTNAIGNGVVCIARLVIDQNMSTGSYALVINGIVISSPSVNPVVGTGVNGSIIVTPASPAVITVGSVSGMAGTIVDVPITFTPGTNASSLPQYDISLPSGITFAGYLNGPAATAAGKNCGGATLGSGFRSLVSGGINAIGAGVLCYARLNINLSLAAGTYPLTISGIVIASPEALLVAGIGVNGSISVTPASLTIYNVSPTGIGGTGADISWSTNLPANSRVEYGLTSSYGSLTPIDATLTTSHSVSLTGLLPCTTYHYRVISSAGITVMSADYSFSTLSLSGSGNPQIAVGSTTGSQGSSINIPLTFTPGFTSSTYFYIDISLPIGMTISSISPGPAAPSKSVTFGGLCNGNGNPYNDRETYRVLVGQGNPAVAFGCGVAETMTVSVSGALQTGSYPIIIYAGRAADLSFGWQTLDVVPGSVVVSGSNPAGSAVRQYGSQMWTPGVLLNVSIIVSPGSGVTSYSVADAWPGWALNSADMPYTLSGSSITFGPFSDNIARTLHYSVWPSGSGLYGFTGSAAFNGNSIAMSGPRVISSNTYPACS
jgi:hypothetical protein